MALLLYLKRILNTIPVQALYLLLGTNLGNRIKNLQTSIELIEKHIGSISACSSIYETTAWGFESKNTFYNQAIKVFTMLSPENSLLEALKIEKEMQRIRTHVGYSDRIIDIDVLFYNHFIIKSETLTVPHPLMHKRMFALKPMAELDKLFVHPVENKTIEELINVCEDGLLVKKTEFQ